jgi:hypothetical protein
MDHTPGYAITTTMTAARDYSPRVFSGFRLFRFELRSM